MILFWPSKYTLAISPIDNVLQWIDKKFYPNYILLQESQKHLEDSIDVSVKELQTTCRNQAHMEDL